jgi:hypothetical protein
MKIETLKTTDLIPYARNTRTHSPEQVSQIAGSIREFGFTNPILIDGENGIIAGHGRVMAASKLGLAKVPCIRLAHLTDTQKRAYIIADNKLALNAGWDEEMLALELGELNDEDFDLSLLGFDEAELGDLMAETTEGETDPDDVPEPPVDPVSVLGDVWILGKHRIVCGDCNDQCAVDNALGGQDWDRLIFDPPYEMEELYATAMLPQKLGAKALVFWDFKRFGIAAKSAMEFGWSPLYELVWDNVTSWFTPNRPLARHKACGVFGDDPMWFFDAAIIRDGKKREAKKVSNTRGDCDYVPLDGAVHLRTVESFPTTSENGGHAHSKPMAWIEAIFRGMGGANYLDLFAGSGSTIIGCEITGTRAHAIELNPAYVDVAVERWQDFAGKQAIHESSGKTFDEMKAAKP